MKVREAADRARTSPNARNEIFNITNCDYFRWQHMWPKIARMFRHGVGHPIPLATYMSDKAPLWGTMVAKHGLGSIPYDKVASRPFGDFIFDSGFDNISSTIMARRAGFHSCTDTEDMFRQQFEQLRARKVISSK
jgi:hypothetical protein